MGQGGGGHFGSGVGEAIVAKTMNTRNASYTNFPQRIYLQLKAYIDAAADYNNPRAAIDLGPAAIKSKTIQLAIPEFTWADQWRQLNLAVTYGRKRGVSLVITRIRG